MPSVNNRYHRMKRERWRARVRFYNEEVYLGVYDTAEEAKQVEDEYRAAKAKAYAEDKQIREMQK